MKRPDSSLELRSLEVPGALGTADDRGAAESFRQTHLVLDTEWSELVLRDATQGQLVLGKHRCKCLLAHFLELLPLISVRLGPDVDRCRACLAYLG